METHETVTCPYCAEEIKAAAVKCKHCGEMVKAHAAAPEPEDSKPREQGERAYYHDSRITVTPRIIKVDEQSYQTANISSVRVEKIKPTLFDFFIFYFGLTFAVMLPMFSAGMAEANSGGVPDPLSMLLSAFICYRLYKRYRRWRTWYLVFVTSAAEQRVYNSRDREHVQCVADAIESAFRSRP